MQDRVSMRGYAVDTKPEHIESSKGIGEGRESRKEANILTDA